MKNKKRKLRLQIFIYMAAVLLTWFLLSAGLMEFLYYLEYKRGVEFPFKFYVMVDVFQAALLVLMNIPFLCFFIKRIDKPIQEIICGLNNIAKGNYNEKISFNAKNELDEIKSAFNEMSKKLAEAEQIKRDAENERNLLFANIAHDLRTPITSIIGFSKALTAGIIYDEEKRVKYAATINSKAVKMNDLIDRLFEYVKLQSDDNPLHIERVDIAEILRNCIADIFTECEERKIKLKLDIPETAVMKSADKLELSRVYANLLNNALKHNSDEIHILARMSPDGKTLIADSGNRIPTELAKNLFSPFVCGDESRRSGGGSGLGLSIARKVMKRLGGDLRFSQSEEETPDNYTKVFIIDWEN